MERTPRMSLRAKEAVIGWLFSGPAMLLIVIFMFVPVLFALYMSFRDVNILKLPGDFIGLKNYASLFQDDLFLKSIWNSLRYAIILVPLNTLGGLFLAVLLDRDLLGIGVFRTIFLLPIMASGVVAATVWQFLLHTDNGVINGILTSIGFARQPFLLSTSQAMPCLAIMTSWMSIGGSIIIFLAGLQGIPSSVYDAAAVDGATGIRAFYYITLPLLRRTMTFVMVLTTIVSLRLFDIVYIMTKGGPKNSTMVLAYFSYQRTFLHQRLGYGSAAGIALLLLIILITAIQLRLSRGGVEY